MNTVRIINIDGSVLLVDLTFSQICRYTKYMSDAQWGDFYDGKNVVFDSGLEIKIVNMDNL